MIVPKTWHSCYK